MALSNEVLTKFLCGINDGNVEAVKEAITEASKNEAMHTDLCFYKSNAAWMPLDYAVSQSNLEIIRLLIENGVPIENGLDPYHTNDSFVSKSCALITAAYYGTSNAIQLLIDTGANINFISSRGETALKWASFFGFSDIVKLLLASGANVDLPHYRDPSEPIVQVRVDDCFLFHCLCASHQFYRLNNV